MKKHLLITAMLMTGMSFASQFVANIPKSDRYISGTPEFVEPDFQNPTFKFVDGSNSSFYAIDHSNNLWVLGMNHDGQLGLGHNSPVLEWSDCSPPSHFVSGEASVLNEKFGILVSLAATRLSSSFMLPQQAVTT